MSLPWSGFEIRTATALCAAIYPSGVEGGLPVGADDVDMARFLRELIAVLPVHVGLLLRISLWIFLLAPPWMGLGLRTLNGLDPEGRDRLVSRLSEHRIYLLRELLLLWKAYAGMGYAADPRVRALLTSEARPEPEGEPEPVALGARGKR